MAEELGDRERWDRRYRERPDRCGSTHRTLLDLAAPVVPRRGRALDLACGSGHNVVWLARHGLEVVGADVSSVALDLVRSHANRAGVGERVEAVEVDLTEGLDAASQLAGPFDAITMFFYYAPELVPGLVERLAPGGALVVEVPNLANLTLGNEKPPRPFLWDRGELLSLVGDLQVDLYAEGVVDGRSVSRLIARRTPAVPPLLHLDTRG